MATYQNKVYKKRYSVVSTEETILIVYVSHMLSGQGVDPTSLLRSSEGVVMAV